MPFFLGDSTAGGCYQNNRFRLTTARFMRALLFPGGGKQKWPAKADHRICPLFRGPHSRPGGGVAVAPQKEPGLLASGNRRNRYRIIFPRMQQDTERQT